MATLHHVAGRRAQDFRHRAYGALNSVPLSRDVHLMYMKRTYSIAAARAKLPAIVRAAETGQVTTIERRGTPVAVVVSLNDYRRLATGTESMWAAWQAFRRRHP